MTKEVLLNELNKNNEFNELSPNDFSYLTEKTILIIKNIYVDGILYSCDDVNCYYLSLSKQYAINLGRTHHQSRFDGARIWLEGYSNDWYQLENTQAVYDRNENIIKIDLSSVEDIQGPCYIDLNINFTNPK